LCTKSAQRNTGEERKPCFRKRKLLTTLNNGADKLLKSINKIMKKIRIILSLFLFYEISFSQNNMCEFNNANDIVYTYTVSNAGTLNKDDIIYLKRIKQFITNKELENLSILKDDEGFRKILGKHSLDIDFSFSTVDDMFKYCKIVVSEKYDLAKSQLDKFFMEKNLLNELKVGKIRFFYFYKDFHSEINLYDYVYCKNNQYLDYYALNNPMLLSTNIPFDGICDQNLIGFEETENFKRYVIPIANKSKCIYMFIYFIKVATYKQ
jgi:hypothetical protein